MRYAVLRRWKDNVGDFEVVEYFSTKEECKKFIKTAERDSRYRWEIGIYE